MDEQGTQMVFYELSIECDSMNRKFEGNTHYVRRYTALGTFNGDSYWELDEGFMDGC